MVEHAEHPAPLPAEARLADPGQPLVGADEDDDHRVVVARVPTLKGRVSISVIFMRSADVDGLPRVPP